MIDFGLGLNASITVTNAAREGARLGVTKPIVASIDARAKAMTAGLDASKVAVVGRLQTTDRFNAGHLHALDMASR